MARSALILAISIAFVGISQTPAYADSTLDEQSGKLNEYGGLGDVKMYCKAKPKVSIDTKSFAKAAKRSENKDKVKNLYSHCSKPLKAVRDWCAEGYEKPVQEQIKSYVCRYGEGDSQMSLKKGVLTMTTNWEREVHGWTKNAVGKVLRDGDFSVGQAALIKNDQGRIKSSMLDMKRRCKGTVKWKVDWKSFKPEIDKRLGKNNLTAIWQHCLAPLTALEQMCVNGQADLMKDQVSSFVCRYDKKADANMSLKKGVLTLTSNFKKTSGITRTASNLVGDTLRDGEFTVRQAAFIKDENAHLERLYGAKVNGNCKTKIPWNVDWKSFEGEIDQRLSTLQSNNTLLYSVCGVPLNRLADICVSDKKNKVKKKIKSYSCALAGPKKGKLSLKKGALTYKVDLGADDAYGNFDKFLVKNRVIKKRPKPKKLSPKDLASIRRILGKGANIQQCYKGCALRCRTARCKQKCRNGCQ